jgi:hypothetical protein
MKQQHEDQPTHSSIAVQKGMDRFELKVYHAGARQCRYLCIGMDEFFQIT